jgi:hypothetical protein
LHSQSSHQSQLSFLHVLVWDDGQNAVHNLVAVQVIDSVVGTLGLVVLNDSSGRGSAEVVLLDVAFFQGSLGGEQFLTHNQST